MIAALAELDHSVALIAALPAFLLSLLDQASNLRILGAIGRFVEFAATHGASFGPAFRAGGALTAFLCVEVRGSDPDATFGVRAVDAVAGVVLVVFLVEVDFELQVEQVFDV